MPLIEESLLNEQKFKELTKEFSKKKYSMDSGEEEDIEDYQNSITSDENESELKEIEEDEDNENDNKEVRFKFFNYIYCIHYLYYTKIIYIYFLK